MQKCIIDGREAEFQPGENLVDVAKRVGVDVPVFCYHPGLSVVAQCRMCVVEVEKMGKLQTACSTAPQAGMVIHTQSPNVKKQRAAVMEFLLLNHPLDCPVCDKSGECDLQDQSFDHGDSYMRSTEERRYYVDTDMGPVIQKNMNRCIHCTRCIRFGEEIAGIREMVALKRGNNVEITTLDGLPLKTEYAGNYSDICPTGSLTLKDFRFNKRVWMLNRTPTVCEGCSQGCNMEIHHESETIYRCLPRENMAINRYWLCDEGRFNYQYTQEPDRITAPWISGSANEDFSGEEAWEAAIVHARMKTTGKKAQVLIGSDLTLEEAKLIQDFAKERLGGAPVSHFGTPGVPTSKDDDTLDGILKRKSKTSNLHGMEKLGIHPFKGIDPTTQVTFVFRGGRAKLPDLGKTPAIGFGVFFQPEAASFQAILPGPAFSEKDGTIVNFQGTEQKLNRAVLPSGDVKTLSEALMLWIHARSSVGAA